MLQIPLLGPDVTPTPSAKYYEEACDRLETQARGPLGGRPGLDRRVQDSFLLSGQCSSGRVCSAPLQHGCLLVQHWGQLEAMPVSSPRAGAPKAPGRTDVHASPSTGRRHHFPAPRSARLQALDTCLRVTATELPSRRGAAAAEHQLLRVKMRGSGTESALRKHSGEDTGCQTKWRGFREHW